MIRIKRGLPLLLLLHAACAGSDATEDELYYGTTEFQRDPALDVDNVSSAGLRRSHNAGENCVRCHQAYGPGRGQFTVAGSVTDDQGEWVPNPIVQLWSAPQQEGGELVLQLSGDAYGNFYTTEALPFPEQSLFVRVTDSAGSRAVPMPFPISNGSCNHCHTGRFTVALRELDEASTSEP